MIFFDESLASIFSFNMLQHTADFSPPETPRSQESQFQLQICEALDLTHSPPLKTTKQRSPATIKIPAVVATSMSQVKSTSCCKLASESPLAIYINLSNMAMGSPRMNRGFQWGKSSFHCRVWFLCSLEGRFEPWKSLEISAKCFLRLKRHSLDSPCWSARGALKKVGHLVFELSIIALTMHLGFGVLWVSSWAVFKGTSTISKKSTKPQRNVSKLLPWCPQTIAKLVLFTPWNPNLWFMVDRFYSQ